MKNLIYIFDDSEIVCEMLKFSIDQNIENHRAEFFTTEDAFKQAIAISPPKVIILDFHLDGGYNTKDSKNAFHIMEFLDKNNLDIPVIIFTSQKDKSTAVKLLKIGAVDYITKNSSTFIEEVLKAIENVIEYNNLRDVKNEAKAQRLRIVITSVLLTLSIAALIYLLYQ